eukprot:GFYU01033113.1.p1 GENE.GFYU01033113.1~~GFYU01033113.1.p1  ORF type:complete len:242 (+),score=61.56 GFYU01033113.1:306-1031(+)
MLKNVVPTSLQSVVSESARFSHNAGTDHLDIDADGNIAVAQVMSPVSPIRGGDTICRDPNTISRDSNTHVNVNAPAPAPTLTLPSQSGVTSGDDCRYDEGGDGAHRTHHKEQRVQHGGAPRTQRPPRGDITVDNEDASSVRGSASASAKASASVSDMPPCSGYVLSDDAIMQLYKQTDVLWLVDYSSVGKLHVSMQMDMSDPWARGHSIARARAAIPSFIMGAGCCCVPISHEYMSDYCMD